MQVKGKQVSEMEVFSNFSKSLDETTSLDDYYKKIVSVFETALPYDLAILFMYDFTERLVVKEKTGVEVNSDIFSNKPANLTLLKSEFNEQKLKIYNDWKAEKELQKLFFKADQIQTVAIIPLISYKRLLGLLCIGVKENYSFSQEEIILIELLAKTTSQNLGFELMTEASQSHIQELRDVAKRMRHDFANDLQSMALSIELLLDTELSDEQSKFMRLLGNAKNSAVEKIKELRSMKKKFEDTIEISFGFPV